MSETLVCELEGCSEPLPPWKGTGRKPKYCSTTHKNTAAARRAKQSKPRANAKGRQPGVSSSNRPRKSPEESADGRGRPRRGPLYEEFVRRGYPREIDAETMTQAQVAQAMNTSKGNVSRWMVAYQQDLAEERKRQERAGERISDEAQASLADFQRFRDRYFRYPDPATNELKAFTTKPFHRRWVDAANEALDRPGGKTMVLSPPRAGKTALLNHLCIWLICRNPNIRIMLVGGNAEIAQDSLQAIQDELVNNEALIHDFAGVDGTFKPAARTGKTWSRDRFTIQGRTATGIRSPTCAAIGRGGTLLSRDADIMIVDDVEDHDSVVQPHARENTKKWFRTQVLSRREAHTAVFVIGSRQHADDLYSALLEDPSFHSIVETAHDESICDSPEDAGDVAHQDCVLFPEKLPYSYLMEQRSSMGKALFEMVYLNRPRAEGLSIFDADEVRACRNPKRAIGDIPKHTRLVAGLDPASTGYQAAVLWAFDPETSVRYLVDLENEQGGGMQQAFETISDWFTRYGCRHWVIEENNFQRAIRNYDKVKDFASRNAIKLDGHETMVNKWDRDMGVTTMAPLFEVDETSQRRHIDLPWADAECERKVGQIIRQWLNFTEATSGKRPAYKSDLVMAAWFPESVIRRWRREFVAEMSVDYAPNGGIHWMTNWSKPPWVGAA